MVIHEKGVKSEHIFGYIMKNSRNYNYIPVLYKGKLVASATSCYDPSYKSSQNSRSPQPTDFYYTLVLAQAERASEDPPFEIEYFIIVVNRTTRFPLREIETGNLMANILDDDPLASPLEEYIGAGSTY
jgi:hypothetical protein